jgi:hypothetical protein
LGRAWPVVLASVALAVVFGVSACGSQGAEGRLRQGTGERMKPLVEQFKDARSRARSDFERAALDRAIKTGRIDPADYEEAFSRYRLCAQGAGLAETYTKLPNGIYRVTPPSDLGSEREDVQAYAKSMADCAERAGLISLEALYRTQVDNPELLADGRLVTVRCLIKEGMVPGDYTVEKLMAFLGSAEADTSAGGDFDPIDAEAQKCLTAGGMAVVRAPGNDGGG